MKTLILAAAIALGSAAPLALAQAGEGNGPSFPGLQVPEIGIATTPYGQHRVVSTFEHESGAQATEAAASPFPQHGTAAQNRQTLAMLRSAMPND